MGRQRVGYSLRPDRIAFLTNLHDPLWLGSCARIMEYCSLVWGGAGHVIVPTDGTTLDSHFWDLLERFEPDYILYYKRTGADIKRDEPARFAEVMRVSITNWEQQIAERSTPAQIQQIEEDLLRSFVDGFQISRQLNDELRERLAPFYFFDDHVVNQISGNSVPRYPHTHISHVLEAYTNEVGPVRVYEASQPELGLWISSALGYIGEHRYESYTKAGGSIRCEAANDLSTVAADVISHATGMHGQHAPEFTVPLDVSRAALGTYQPLSNHDYGLPTLVVAGQGIVDFCYYMCLSRMRVRVFWMPPWLLRGMRNLNDDPTALPDAFYFGAAVRSGTAYASQYSSEVELVSMTLTAEERSDLLKQFKKQSLISADWRVPEFQPFRLQPVRLYERNNAGIPELHDLNSDGVIELYTGRPPKHLKDFSPQDIRWIAEITFDDVQIPVHHALGTWIAGRTTREARTGRNTVCYLNVNMMVLGSDDPEAASYRPYLRVPTALGIFKQISQAKELTASPSDKGIYTKVTIDKFGSLEAAASFFRSELGRKLTVAYQADRASSVGIYLPDEQRRFLDWDTIRNLCADEKTCTSLIDDFSSKGIFYRGFIFQCDVCRRSSWYPIADLTDAFTCKRCRRNQTYISAHWKSPQQPLWYHQLDEVVYQAIRNDCHIPILAMSALAANSGGKFSYCEELDFIDNSSRVECDLNCIADGLLTVGEVKKDSRLAATHKKEAGVVAKYLLLAERLNATRVVFATLAEEWRPETSKLIHSCFSDKRQKVILLTRKDLLL